MQTSSLVKKRLNDLKMLSQNLKQSTQVRKDLDINLIKAIFDITKTINKQQSRIQNNPIQNVSTHQGAFKIQKSFSNSLGSSKLTKNMSHSILPKYINKTQSFDYSIDEQNIQPLFIQKSTSHRQIPSYKKIANTHQEQLIHLRQLNCKLQIQVRQMRQQLNIYKQKQQMQRQKMYKKQQVPYHNINWNEDSINNSHPYFQLYEQIQLFSTKLSINNQDYPKIDYIKCSMRLTLDKILIKKDISSNTNSPKHLSKDSNNSIQQLKIINITQVNYLSKNYMMILFSEGDNQDKTRLFLHFTDQQTLHRWDLGIFINFKIITNLTADKLFQRQNNTQQKLISDQSKLKQEKQNNTQIQDIFQNSQDTYIIKKYLENKKKYIESQKNLKKDWLQRISQKKITSKQQKLNVQLKYTKSQQKLLELPLQNEAYFNDQKIEQFQQTEVNSAILFKNDNINNNFLKKQNNQLDKQLQNSIQKINKQHKSAQELIRIKLEEQKRKQQQQRLIKVQQAFQVVKKGMLMTKYAKGAIKPHQKKVYISQDNKRLCWQDKDSFQFKYVLVSEIICINRGEIGQGVQTHLDIKKIKNENCFLKINLNSKQRKTLQFSMTSLNLMDKFCQSLIIFLSQIRKQNQYSK